MKKLFIPITILYISILGLILYVTVSTSPVPLKNVAFSEQHHYYIPPSAYYNSDIEIYYEHKRAKYNSTTSPLYTIDDSILVQK